MLEYEQAWQRFLTEVRQLMQPSDEPSASAPSVAIQSPESQNHLGKLQLTETLTEYQQEILELIAQGLSHPRLVNSF